MDAALEKRQVKRAYKLYAPAYDFIFDWIFNPGREAAIQLLGIRRGQQVLEVGIGTGLNLPLYPSDCRIAGIDLSEEMLKKAQEKVVELASTTSRSRPWTRPSWTSATTSSIRRWRPTRSAPCPIPWASCARCAGSSSRAATSSS